MHRVGEGGFVLPVALVVLVLLSMVASAGVYSSRTDLRAALATREAAVALAAADAGAARTIALWGQAVPSLPAPGDSVIVDWQTLPDGSRYRSAVHRPPAGPDDVPSTTVVLVTTGQVPPPGNARRSVATFVDASLGFGAICCDAGFKVSSRMRVDGADRRDPVPEVSGLDNRPAGWPAATCPAPPQNVPGILTSRRRDVDIRRNGDVAGAPPVSEDPSVDPTDFVDLGGGTYADIAASADIGLVGNQRFRGEIGPVVSGGTCDTSVSTNWGSPLAPAAPCGAHFPVIHVAGDLRLQRGGSGQGVLLVDGDLDMQDDFSFYGIIVVLGTVTIEDDSRVFGGILARGNANGRGRSEVKDRAKIFYSSCAAQRAQASLGSGAGGATANHWFEVIG